MGLRPTRVLVPVDYPEGPGGKGWRVAGQFYADTGARCFQWIGGRDHFHQSPRPLLITLLGFLLERGCQRLVHLETDEMTDLHNAVARTIPLGRYIGHGVLVGGTDLLVACGFAHWSDCRGVVRPRRGRLPGPSVMVYVHEADAFVAYLYQQDIDMPPLHVRTAQTWTLLGDSTI